jgi:serine/threonine protein kinase
VTEGHDDDDDAPRPSPGDWNELMNRVAEETWVKAFDPSNPLVKIGRFDAIAVIGEGGFGIVFKAHDPDLDRLVALKLCRTRSKRAIDALIHEAKVLAKLAHPNIVTIFEPGHHDGAVFFAMQHIGENAERFAKRNPPPTWREIVDVYLGAGRGLAAAHAHPDRIVHGDVKPSNILVDSDGFSRIADFGLARRVIEDAEASEREGLRRRAGTLYYMAPEALCGEPCDARSDQFSFFVALCQTLSGGKLPFYGKTSSEVLEAMERTDVLQFLGPSVPVELKAVIRIGLSLDSCDRFPDMETALAELEGVLQMAPPSSPLGDEPEHDEPESEGPDEPERMHEPESLGEPVLMLGEPEGLVGESQAVEPVLVLEPELMPPIEGPELTPLGGGPAPSHAKRGTRVLSASLVLTVGLMLGWLGRARVEGPRPSEPVREPVPLPSSPCALGEQGVSTDIDPVVLAVCTYIRRGQIDDADKTWKSVYLARWDVIESLSAVPTLDPAASATLDPAASATLDPAEAADKLAADTMVIVQTFQEWAKLSAGPDVARANDLVLHWTLYAEKAWSKAESIREKQSGRAEQPAPK